MIDLNDLKMIIEDPDINFFETLTSVFTYREKNLRWNYKEIYNVFHESLRKNFKDSIRNKIKESLKQDKINAIYSIFEIGLKDYFNEEELLKLVECSLEMCIKSQKQNFSYRLQTFIDILSSKFIFTTFLKIHN